MGLFFKTALFWAIALQILVISYQYSLRKSPEERSSHLIRGGSLKSRIGLFLHYVFHTGFRIRYEMTIVRNMHPAKFKISVQIVTVAGANLGLGRLGSCLGR